MNTIEEWRPVAGFDGYDVSNLGRVRSWRPGRWKHRPVPRVLAGGVNPGGYKMVCLMTGKEKRQVTRLTHRLVAIAFLGPIPQPPSGAWRIEVCHIDGDQTNNAVSNLRYGTPKQNAADSIAHGTHTSLSMKAKTHCKYGHEFTPENTAMRHARHGNGLVRSCRICERRKSREHAAKKRAQAGAAKAVGDAA